MTTYNSVNFFKGDGGTKVFNFGFLYISKEHVKVQIDKTELEQGNDYSITDESVTLINAPTSGVTIRIYRETPTNGFVEWADGNYLLAADMNIEQLQTLYILQEQQDLAKLNNIADNGDGYFDAVNKQIKNVADPTADQDVVTKKYMESVSDGFVAENTTIQNDIKSRQTDIIARQTDVTTKQSNVAAMKTSVEASQADVTTKQTNVATMKTSVEASQADVTAKQANVATMKTSVEASQADVVARQSDVATMKTSVEASQADVTTKQANVATMKTSVEASQADVTTKQANVATMESNVEALQSKFNIPTQIYPGTILPWGSDTIPYGYLLCDGSAISRTTYSELFAQIGTTFGSGDGSTTFNVPDLRNKTIVGKGTSFATLGGTGGEIAHTLTQAEMPSHAHPFSGTTSTNGEHTHTVYIIVPNSGDNNAGFGSDNTYGNQTTSANGNHSHTFSGTTQTSGSSSAHNNMPPYMVINWIIKYTVVGKSNADALYLQRNTSYTAGEIILGATNLSRQYVLICTTAGTTGTSDITTWGAINDITTDGTAMFVTRPASEILPVIQVTANKTLLSYQVASYVNCTGSTAYTVTMPTPASSSGGAFVVRNANSQPITLSTPSGNFIGPHGTNTNTLVVPANVIVGLYTGGSNWVVTTWETRYVPIINKSSAYTLQESELESMVVLSGSTTYTLTLPTPTTAGHTVSIRNAGSVAMTLSTPSGIFDGPNGTSLSTMPLPSSVICGLLSNGTNWVVERYQVNWNNYYTKTEVDALVGADKNIYGSSFDGVNSTGTRLYASSGLSWSPSTDVVAGTDDFTGKSVWDGFDVLVKYDSSVSKAKIVAYEGTSAFDRYKNDDSYGADVFHMFPKGYFRRIATDSVGAETKLVSTKEYANFRPSPMHYRGGVLHDYIGITKYGWCDDGNGGICSRSGKPPKINITENNFETLTRAKGLRVGGINDVSWLQHIGCIKYNSLNWQNSVGQGVVNIYAIATATVTESGVSRIIVSNTDAAKFSVGTLVQISSVGSGYWWPISAIATYDTSNMAITVTSGTTFNTTSGSTTIETSCLKSGSTDTVLGQDGAVSAGTDGKRSILTMGIENFYGNTWKLLAGACRIGSNIYINPTPDTQYAWPSSDSDALSKGWVKYGGTYCASTGYISTFGLDSNYPHILLASTVGGNSNNPVGDQYYTNADTTVKVMLFGGCLSDRYSTGPFCASLIDDVGLMYWYFCALGVFIP